MTEKAATRWSWWVMASVGLLGMVLILVPAASQFRRVMQEDPFERRMETKTVQTADAAGKVTGTETTVSPAEHSLLEQSLAAGGLLMLRVAVVAITAFLAGALTQRTLLGRFVIKLGPVELDAVVGDTTDSLKKVTQQLSRQRSRITTVAQDSADGIDRLTVALEAHESAYRRRIEGMAAFDADLDRRVQAIEDEGRP